MLNKEIVENLDKASLKDVKESKEEAKILGDSDKEQIDSSRTLLYYTLPLLFVFYQLYFIHSEKPNK